MLRFAPDDTSRTARREFEILNLPRATDLMKYQRFGKCAAEYSRDSA